MQLSPEVSLLHRIVQRDPAAVSQLYDLQSGYLYAIILRIVGDESDAESVLQEVFLKVWERADSYNAELLPPSVWLTRIARNLAIDRLCSKSPKAGSREDDIESGQQNARADNPPIHSEEQREVAEAMMELPLEQRSLIEHAYFEGYTQSELAEHFELPLGTVKTRIRSGMIMLRTRLQHLIEKGRANEFKIS